MLAAALAVPIAGYVVYLAQPGSTLFSWHPFFMSMAFAGLMPAAVESFGLTLRPVSRRLTLHWALATSAALLTLLGWAAIYWNKEARGAPHLSSSHGQLGAAAAAGTVVQCAGGLLAKYAGRLPPQMAPRLTRALHTLSGTVLACLGLYVVHLGLQSAWFTAQVAAPALLLPAADLLLSLSALRLLYRFVTAKLTLLTSALTPADKKTH